MTMPCTRGSYVTRNTPLCKYGIIREKETWIALAMLSFFLHTLTPFFSRWKKMSDPLSCQEAYEVIVVFNDNFTHSILVDEAIS